MQKMPKNAHRHACPKKDILCRLVGGIPYEKRSPGTLPKRCCPIGDLYDKKPYTYFPEKDKKKGGGFYMRKKCQEKDEKRKRHII